ncbi:MAG TPA: hemerythrin domain-containing protein [Burkholderiaceae bacterium]|nr:hemerythrin domain-containing protein [Burkholderiaceae bacterium]
MNAQVPLDVSALSTEELVTYIVSRFHTGHREQLPELITLSRRVEHVHAGHARCPAGLADELEAHLQEMESHMLKEEQVLFPMLCRGMNGPAQGPISVMKFEHGHHFDAIERIHNLTQDLIPPDDACNTWRALYAGLATYARELAQHIKLENDVLFAQASQAVKGAQNA